MLDTRDEMDDFEFGHGNGFSLRPDAVRQRRWRGNNQERARLRNLIDQNNLRARRYGAEGRITVERWLTLCDSFAGKCARCDDEGNLQIDHIRPLSLEGSNTIENIQPLCRLCNKLKGAQEIDYRNRC